MAQAGSSRNRPLSPHIQVWRWGPGMITSIIGRISGIGATIGLGLLLWWLGALVSGADDYARFANLWWGPNDDWHILLKLILVGVSWALFAHALTGIRHFVLNMGAGYELDTNKFWANATTIGSFVVTALFWAAVLLR
jgi:succinate dehydrogenase / fumarate reductase cytochrome b subunit